MYVPHVLYTYSTPAKRSLADFARSQTTSDLKQNAAWQIAQSLPPMLDVTPAHPSRIRIMVHPTPIPMTYAACAKFLEELTTTQPNEFNLILHLDNAIDDQKIFRLERYARKRGYDQKDAEGKFASDVTEPEHWQNFEARAQTSAATSDVMERWSSDSSVSLSIVRGNFRHCASLEA